MLPLEFNVILDGKGTLNYFCMALEVKELLHAKDFVYKMYREFLKTKLTILCNFYFTNGNILITLPINNVRFYVVISNS